MSRISDLISRMCEIPQKEKRATQIGEMVLVRDKLAEAADLAEKVGRVTCALAEIKKADFIENATQHLASASGSATSLRRRFENKNGFERKRADDALIQINERLDTASKTLIKGWRALVDEKVKRLKPLADAAERAALPGAHGLRQSIALIEAIREAPPETAKAARDYFSSETGLNQSIASLGLEGRAGKFLIDAANGSAKAKDLQDEEVLAFLGEYPAVWSMLKVGF